MNGFGTLVLQPPKSEAMGPYKWSYGPLLMPYQPAEILATGGAADDYFAGGRSLRWYVVAGSLMSLDIHGP